jgi:hypothetical protein
MSTSSSTTHRPDTRTLRDRPLAGWIAEYRNERAANNDIFRLFGELTRQTDWLSSHRDWVEANNWGFGDRPFHHMWRLILQHLAERGGPVACLEIGVFKGQVVSLWSLIGDRCRIPLRITAVSPFAGSSAPAPRNRLIQNLLAAVSRRYRDEWTAGNLYERRDYLADCKRIFDQFGLDFSEVEVVRGFSTDQAVLDSLAGRVFDLVYIDGDHSEEVATHDVKSFAPKVVPGGFIVMDDASLTLDIDLHYRGRPGATKAAELLPSMGFVNVLNVGHNRVYQRR